MAHYVFFMFTKTQKITKGTKAPYKMLIIEAPHKWLEALGDLILPKRMYKIRYQIFLISKVLRVNTKLTLTGTSQTHSDEILGGIFK